MSGPTPLADPVPCSVCGSVLPRAEMFGAEPDLVCPSCADQVRRRYERRLAPLRSLKPPVLTSFFLAAAVALFVAAHVISPQPAWVRSLRMDVAVWDGELWRLVTSAFLHAGPGFQSGWTMGILHLGFNAWWFWELGRGIEGAWGPLAIAGLVLGSAATASTAQWLAQGAGIGLSGVVFALAGFLFALRKVHPVGAALMNPHTTNTLIVWFVLSIVLSASGTLPIGNWAHGGGAAWGLLAGFAVRHRLRRLWVPLVALLTVAIAISAWTLAFGSRARERDAYRAWQARWRVVPRE